MMTSISPLTHTNTSISTNIYSKPHHQMIPSSSVSNKIHPLTSSTTTTTIIIIIHTLQGSMIWVQSPSLCGDASGSPLKNPGPGPSLKRCHVGRWCHHRTVCVIMMMMIRMMMIVMMRITEVIMVMIVHDMNNNHSKELFTTSFVKLQ